MLLPIPYGAVRRKTMYCYALVLCLAAFLGPLPLHALTLAEAERLALSSEPGIVNMQQQSLALKNTAVADRQLPDPTLQIGAVNLPTDSFDLDQEPMTQMRLAIKQSFPAGKTLALQQRRTLDQAASMNHQAAQRRLAVLRELRISWFEALYWRKAIEIYTRDKQLFANLLDTTQSLYRVGRKEQRDVIRAELELSQLENRLLQAENQRDMQHTAIARWIGAPARADSFVPIESELESRTLATREHDAVAQRLRQHPALQTLASLVHAGEQSVALAKESYKPSWALELGYGLRDGQNADMTDRADFLSVVASVQLPLFTAKRQDKVAAASVHQRAARHAAYMEALRGLTRETISAHDRAQQLSDRMALYKTQILPQAHLHAEAALAAYQADTSDFAELMRAWLSEQTFRLEYSRLQTDRQQTLSTLHYLLPSETELEAAP